MADAILEQYERLTAEKSKLEAEIGAIVDELTSGNPPAGIKGALVDADGFPRGDIDVYRVRHQRHAFAVKQYDHKAVMQRIEEILPQVFEAKTAKAKKAAMGADVKPPSSPDVKFAVEVTESAAAPVAAYVVREIDAADKMKKPFAVVENVQTGKETAVQRVNPPVCMIREVFAHCYVCIGVTMADSPAEWADLHAADQVLVFGTADATNHRNFEAIKEIVMHNIGSPIRVIVRRALLRKTAPASTTTATDEEGGSAVDQWEFHELLLTPQQWRGPGVLGCLLMPVQEDEEVLSSP